MKPLLAILLFLFAATPAHAQQGFQVMVPLLCNTSEMVLSMLHEKYQELPIGGDISKDQQVRLFTSHGVSDKETWTLVVSDPNGTTCIIRGGQNWIVAPLIPKGNPT